MGSERRPDAGKKPVEQKKARRKSIKQKEEQIERVYRKLFSRINALEDELLAVVRHEKPITPERLAVIEKKYAVYGRHAKLFYNSTVSDPELVENEKFHDWRHALTNTYSAVGSGIALVTKRNLAGAKKRGNVSGSH